MHDMLQELGRKIVRQNAPNEPWKWSRIWRSEDFESIMSEKMAINNVEAIRLKSKQEAQRLFSRPKNTTSGAKEEENTTVRAESLSRMNRLRLLILKDMNISGSLISLSNELRYLEWEDYPFTYFPSSCELTKLVELVLICSNIKQLWKGTKPLDNLKIINLSYSQNLVKTPDFSGAPNLKELVLQGCTKLVRIHPSIGRLRKLVDLNLANCTSLKSLPSSIFGVSSLACVNLLGCSKLFHSEQFESARHGVSDTAIQSQSTISSIFKRLKLVLPFHFFNSRRHNDIVGLLISSLARLSCLHSLDLSYCNLLNIPEAITLLYCLQKLRLRGNNFVTLPCFIKELPGLRELDLEHCKQLTSLYEFPLRTNLRRLNDWGYYARLSIFDCPKLVERASWSRIALSWMIQLLKVYKESTVNIEIVIPGDRIPSWFKRQTPGHSLTIEPFLNVHDNNWIGIVFCATFVTHYDPPSSSDAEERPEISCLLLPQKLKRCGCLSWHVAQIEETKGTTVELVHLFLSYVGRQGLIALMEYNGLHDLDGCHFIFSARGNCRDLQWEVKNWGMRVVFKQDLEELNGDG